MNIALDAGTQIRSTESNVALFGAYVYPMLSDIDHILLRAHAIRVTAPELARLSGKPVSTVARFARRKSGNTETLKALTRALEEEERRLLNHLSRLHRGAP